MSLKIDHINLETPVILAPMSGVTDLPFRVLVKKLGAGLVVSEMIASEAMVRQTKRTLKMIEKTNEKAPCSVQLAGCDPNVMAEAARLNEALGAHIIDINMGCPVKKVVNGWAGSALMKDELLAHKIMEAVVKAVKIPVTLKMRTGWDEQNRNAPKLAKIAEESGIKMLTVHGRTRSQMYNGKSDWSFIRTVKESVNIPVIGNGDVLGEEDARSMLDISLADGVMVGRGAYGKPWLLNNIAHYLKTGKKLEEPTLQMKYQIMKEHLDSILTHYGEETGSKIARKHIGWYSKGLDNSTYFRVNVNQTENSKQMYQLMDNFFKPYL
ncbi:MAG: tRNA dihydrouridine synthase DusB [Proteobacteria bacterium]|nr:tRNA dihydrouridine synthase DusB [Pseudomonadota bacterium]